MGNAQPNPRAVLEYEKKGTPIPRTPLRLAAAGFVWSLPMGVAGFMVWYRRGPYLWGVIWGTACLGLPFTALCILAGAAIFPPKLRWRFFLWFIPLIAIAVALIVWNTINVGLDD